MLGIIKASPSQSSLHNGLCFPFTALWALTWSRTLTLAMYLGIVPRTAYSLLSTTLYKSKLLQIASILLNRRKQLSSERAAIWSGSHSLGL